MNARRGVIVLTTVLLLSVALNLLLFVAARRYYLQGSAAPLDPLGLSFYPAGSNPQPPTTAQLRVVFFGDSRAYDWPAVLADESGVVRREYSRDMLHLQETGYEALNEQLAMVLETLGSQIQVDER